MHNFFSDIESREKENAKFIFQNKLRLNSLIKLWL